MQYKYIDFLFPELITIEDFATIAPFVKILAHSKPGILQKEVLKSYAASVIIKRGAFIGMGSIILPGVVIGEESIIGAGSIVTKSIPAKSFAAGIPAKVIKKFR